MERHRLIDGLRQGYVAEAGLIAHGRGEAFDYLLGERTVDEAKSAEEVAVAMLLLSENPVISVNGNTAALVPKEIVDLSEAVGAKVEVNLFYRTPRREEIIEGILIDSGAEIVYGIEEKTCRRITRLDSERGRVDSQGIWVADTVLVPLEDGDRAEALVEMGKKVIAVDLNPLSRTSQKATLSIVDNVSRAVPNMIAFAEKLRGYSQKELRNIINTFDNKGNLDAVVERIRRGL